MIGMVHVLYCCLSAQRLTVSGQSGRPLRVGDGDFAPFGPKLVFFSWYRKRCYRCRRGEQEEEGGGGEGGVRAGTKKTSSVLSARTYSFLV